MLKQSYGNYSIRTTSDVTLESGAGDETSETASGPE